MGHGLRAASHIWRLDLLYQALARALRNLLQEAPHLNCHFLAASPLQDAACATYHEVRFMITTRIDSEAPTVWLDRRPIDGGLHHVQVPSCLHAEDFNLFEHELTVDLAAGGHLYRVHNPAVSSRTPRRRPGSNHRSLPPRGHSRPRGLELPAVTWTYRHFWSGSCARCFPPSMAV